MFGEVFGRQNQLNWSFQHLQEWFPSAYRGSPPPTRFHLVGQLTPPPLNGKCHEKRNTFHGTLRQKRRMGRLWAAPAKRGTWPLLSPDWWQIMLMEALSHRVCQHSDPGEGLSLAHDDQLPSIKRNRRQRLRSRGDWECNDDHACPPPTCRLLGRSL